MPDVGQTYTPNTNLWEQQAQKYRGMVGDNPAAIKAAFAAEATKNSQPLQETIGGQTSALDQMRAADTQLAGQYAGSSQAATQQMGINQGARAALSTATAYDPNAQNGQPASNFDLNSFLAKFKPVEASMTPFAASANAGVLSDTGKQTFDLASMQRKSVENAIGSDASNVAQIAQYQIQREEDERKAKELLMRQNYEDLRQLRVLTGGDLINPYTGEKEHYPTPEEKLSQEQKAKNSTSVLEQLKGKTGLSGKTLIDEVNDGLGNFSDVLREQAGKLSQDEIYELARVNSARFGAFRENEDQLRAMGLDPAELDKRGIPRAGGSSTGDNSGYITMVRNGQMKITDVPAEMRDKVASAVAQQGMNKIVTPEQQTANKEVADLAQEILNRDTNPLTGTFQQGTNKFFHPFGGAATNETTKTKIEQLKSKLSLAVASSMQGQGTLSDSERKLIESSIAALNYNMGDADFKNEIQKIANIYGSNQNSNDYSQSKSGGVASAGWE